MGRKLTNGELLRYRKWVPQQLGDVMTQGSGDSRPMGARYVNMAANHNSTHFFCVFVVDQTLTVLIFFGRPDRKLFLTGVPILPWSPPRTQRTSKSHNCPYLIIFWWFQLPINMYLHLVNHFVSYLQQTDSQQLQISSVATLQSVLSHCILFYV